MDSKIPLGIPVIDFSNLDLQWDLVKSQVGKAMKDYGCFKALFNGAPPELQNSIFKEMDELFQLPSETKMRVAAKDLSSGGYGGPSPHSPLSETMTIKDPSCLDKVESLASDLWPQTGNSSFSKTVASFAEKLSDFEKIIRRMVMESLGVEKYWDEHMNSIQYFLRMIKYASPETAEPKPGLPAHTDKCTLTIICQNEVDGLEIQTKEGVWTNANEILPDSFVVLAGEPLHAWANGRVHSPTHRVTMAGNKARYSALLIPTFKAGYMVKVPEELVDEQHPLQFNPFDAWELLKFCIANDPAAYGVKAYCGTTSSSASAMSA